MKCEYCGLRGKECNVRDKDGKWQPDCMCAMTGYSWCKINFRAWLWVKLGGAKLPPERSCSTCRVHIEQKDLGLLYYYDNLRCTECYQKRFLVNWEPLE